MTDWETQHEWMLATRVREAPQGGRDAGGGIKAFTGVGRLGFWDTMTIMGWQAPRLVEADHIGWCVASGCSALSRPGRAVGSCGAEEVDPPLGPVGWYVVKPSLAAWVAYSLRRLARYAASRPASPRGATKRVAAG